VTNALRHSQARTCSIIGRRRGGMIVLEVVNDGAFGPMGEGSGLAGLAERARALADTKLIDIELVRMLRSRSPNARPALRR
jgi:two-component system, NarL family, sensor histidine kinase DesK